jgi:lipoate-protein ligase A
VTNIANYLPEPMKVEDFGNLLFSEINKLMTGSQIYSPTKVDLAAIQKLSVEKYRTWEWIFGYSPRYRFTNELETEKGEILISLQVEKGLMVEVSVSGAIEAELSQKLSEGLLGCRHDLEDVSARIFALNGMLKLEGVDLDSFVGSMF